MNWATKIFVTSLTVIAAAEWARLVVLRARPGLARLLLALPALCAYCALPFLFDIKTEMLSRASVAAMFMWLASFKLLALVSGRGDLVKSGLAWHQFHALLTWPILPATNPDGSIRKAQPQPVGQGGMSGSQGALPTMGGSVAAQAWARLTHRVPEYTGMLVVCLWGLTGPQWPLFLKAYAGAFGVCAYSTLWANACAAMVMLVHGLEVAPSWNRPWLQTSLADFWGRRWNLPASASLRYLVHEPLAEGRWVARPASSLGQQGTTATSSTTDTSRLAASTSTPGNDSSIDPSTNSLRARKAAAAAQLAPAGAEESTATKPIAHPVGSSETGEAVDASGYASSTQTSSKAAPSDVVGKAGGRSGRRGGAGSRRLLGMAGAFFVSGLMHEVLLWTCTGGSALPQLGKQTLYFMVMVPMMVIEQQLKARAKKAGFVMPTWAAIPLASLALQIPGYFLFWSCYFNAVRPPASSPLVINKAAVLGQRMVL